MQIRFTCTSSQWSGGKDIPVECRTHQYVTEALLYPYYSNYAKLQGSCPFVPAFIHCVNVAKRGGGAVALRVRERGGRGGGSEHTTLCTQNPEPPPYNKIDGIRWDHVSPLTVQLDSYGARYALAGVGSAKCQASLHQSAAMTSSSSQWQRERISLLSVCLCMCMHVFVFIFLQYMFCQRK